MEENIKEDAKTLSPDEILLTGDENLSPQVLPQSLAAEPSATCLMPLSVETLRRCLKMYFDLLEQMPFNCCSQLTFDGLIEQIFVVGFNDYEQRQTESAIARRVQLLIGKSRCAPDDSTMPEQVSN